MDRNGTLGAGSNPLAGGSSANTPATNPLAGGLPNLNPAQQGGTPAGHNAGSNPLAGGSSGDQANNSPTSDDDPNAPISADVFREKMRSEAALRKRVQELEARFKAQEDAKLTEQERDKRALADLAAEKNSWLAERQALLLQRDVDAQVRERNLVDSSAILAILKTEYADQIDFDDAGIPINAKYLIDRAVEKYPFLVQPAPQGQAPNSGRLVSPPRTPAGQYAPRQQSPTPAQPIPYSQFERLGDLKDADWDTSSRNQGPTR